MQLMRFVVAAALTMAAAPVPCAEAPAPAVPSYIGRYESKPQDEREIRQVIADFQTALMTKNILLLSSLMMNAHIPFQSPPSPEIIRKQRAEFNPHADGLRAGGYRDFSRFIIESKGVVEERFYNVKITQDQNLAFVLFDYEFVESGKLSHHGLEAWQMMKNVDGKWKIAGVWWTQHPIPQGVSAR